MKASGPKEERETIIRFDEDMEGASIWTASDVVYRRLIKRLGTDYLVEDEERHAIFEVPKGWIKLPRKPSEAKRRQGLALARAKQVKSG